MEKEEFEKRVHRPKPHLLVGFSKEELEKMRCAGLMASRFMLEWIAGADGLTIRDRMLLEKAKTVVTEWKAIIRLLAEAETQRCKELLREHMERAFKTELIQKIKRSKR